MNDVAPGIGDNKPPLGELLIEDTRPLIERKDALLKNLAESKIETDEDAAKVTTLGGLLKAHRDTVEEARKAAAKPYDDGKLAVQRAFKQGILDPLDDALNTVRRMIDDWRAALRRRQADEDRQRQEAAAAAQREADEAAKKRQEAEKVGDPAATIQAEMAELQARDRAQALTDPPVGLPSGVQPIRTQVGTATVQTQRVPVVTNIGLALKFLIEHQPGAVLEAIGPLIARLVKAKVDIPGVEVRTQEATRLRR